MPPYAPLITEIASDVLRTEVKSYYASIDLEIPLDQLRPLIPEGRVLVLIWQ